MYSETYNTWCCQAISAQTLLTLLEDPVKNTCFPHLVVVTWAVGLWDFKLHVQSVRIMPVATIVLCIARVMHAEVIT